MAQWSTLKERIEGKWQVPLFGLSLVLLGATFWRLRSATPNRTPEMALDAIADLIAQGFPDQAIEYAERFAAQPDHNRAELAKAQLLLARARSADAADKRLHSERVGRDIVNSYLDAKRFGLALTGDDYSRLGRAFEWQDRIKRAIGCYEQAIDLGVSDRPLTRKRMIELLLTQQEDSPATIIELLDALLAELEPQRKDLRIWAIDEKLFALQALDRLPEASALLEREKDSFEGTDQFSQFEFLQALYLYDSGALNKAELSLRTLRNRLDRTDPVYAMTGWLLGRVVLDDEGAGRPEEALSFFEDVIAFHPKSLYAAASRIGAAEALVVLERHAQAIETYRIAMSDLARFPGQHLVSREVLRGSLAVAAEAQRQAGHSAPAVGYAKLAVQLMNVEDVEQSTLFLQLLAQTQGEYADDLQRKSEVHGEGEKQDEAVKLAGQASEQWAAACDTSLRLAKINTLNTRLGSDWSWRAADFASRSGDDARAIKLYRTFVGEYPGDSLVPRALFRIGHHNQVLGRLTEAVEAYQEVYRSHPRTLEGSQALVPLARCYLAMGPDQEELAEKTLRLVLEDSQVLTPEAPEFAQALFLLGEVLSRRKQYENAIATLEEAAARYPADPRIWRSRFLLADAYRKSALALKEEAAHADLDSEMKQMKEQSQLRFQHAWELFRSVITEYELRGPDQLDRLERLYLRYAMLYEADCYFEAGRFGDALKQYEEAASTYQDSTSALAAYVQIINCYVFLGQPQEARASLARALIVGDALRPEAFTDSVSPETRTEWKRYFEWLGASGLF